MNLKRLIYKGLRISNDINAIRRGRIGRPIGRQLSKQVRGKYAKKIIRRLLK